MDFPTQKQATLYLIITDLSQQYSLPMTLPRMERSIHLFILLMSTHTLSVPRAAVTKSHRPMPDSYMREFGHCATHHLWTEVLDVQDFRTKWQNYITTTTKAFHHFFPAKNITTHLFWRTTDDAPHQTTSMTKEQGFPLLPLTLQETKEQGH